MPQAYLWKQRPNTDEAMRKKIARAFGTNSVGYTDIYDRKGNAVRITVDNVFRHNWIEHPERWAQVPLIKTLIEAAHRLTPGKAKGREFYSSQISYGHRGEKGKSVYFATHVKHDPAPSGLRFWVSSHIIGENQLRKWEKEKGPSLWEAPSRRAEPRNPTPARPHSGASRSGRPPVAYSQYSTEQERPSRSRRLLVVLGGILALAYLKQQQEAHQW